MTVGDGEEYFGASKEKASRRCRAESGEGMVFASRCGSKYCKVCDGIRWMSGAHVSA